MEVDEINLDDNENTDFDFSVRSHSETVNTEDSKAMVKLPQESSFIDISGVFVFELLKYILSGFLNFIRFKWCGIACSARAKYS